MVARATTLAFLPQWTKRVVTDLGGRDPLGLSRVGQLLTDQLLPGITTQTNRARYYALYCWILWHIHDQEKPHRWEEFVQSFQRREAAIALSTLVDDSDSSPVGKQAVSLRLAGGQTEEDINTSFRVLPSNQLGGFGQYYAGSLYELGLTHRPEDGLSRVTEGVAEKLAVAVQRMLADTPYIKRKLFADSKIALKSLRASSERLTINAIKSSFASEERRLLIDVFFGLQRERSSTPTSYRRRSLARILSIVSAYEGAGIPVESESLIRQLLYGPAYFGVLVDARHGTSASRLLDGSKGHPSFGGNSAFTNF